MYRAVSPPPCFARSDASPQIVLNSMHRYQPRIHVVEQPTESRDSKHGVPLLSHCFKEMQFIAVTAYQNSDVSVHITSTLVLFSLITRPCPD